MNRLVLLFCVCLTAFAAQAYAGDTAKDDAVCATLPNEVSALAEYTPEELKIWIQAAVDRVQKEKFPELSGRKITARPKPMHEDYYFSVAVAGRKMIGPRDSRHYYVNYNPSLSERSPSLSAIEGVLVHELQHIADIDARSVLGNVIRVLPQVFSVHQYERNTDRNAITRGAGEGLLLYRCWLYDFLTEKQLEKKRKRYLTPTEIKALMSKAD